MIKVKPQMLSKLITILINFRKKALMNLKMKSSYELENEKLL
jgi:hypothetical protein